MAQYFRIHPDNPQGRLIRQAATILEEGGVAAYPTDSCYALGCLPGGHEALSRIIRIRQLDPRHHMTLLCRDLSAIGRLARVDNSAFRLFKSLTPGPYTFLLKASRDVPRRLQHPKKKTVGIRVPDNAIVLALLGRLGQPLVSTSLILPDAGLPETEPELIRERIGDRLDLVIDGGACGSDLTTVIDLSSGVPEVLREGIGSTDALGRGP